MKKLDGLTLNEKDKEDDTETLMTKELLYSATNSSASPPEAGSRLATDTSYEETKNESYGSGGGDWDKNTTSGSVHLSINPEVLSINHTKIKVIRNLEGFTNLRRLTLADNMITKIQGLQNCKLLEELSLEKNRITKIEGVNHLQYLKKLDIGSNKIKVIESLEGLENLTQLSLEDNEIDSLRGLETLVNLMELYIGNNCFTNLKQTCLLKKLPKLIILDISGNEM